MTCTVTGNVIDLKAQPKAGLSLTFGPQVRTIARSGTSATVPDPVTVETDASGNFSVALLPGVYTVKTEGGTRASVKITVPEEATAVLAQIIDAPAPVSVDTAQQAVLDARAERTQAQEARDKAAKWATEAEDTEVATGQYSALHHAAKAAADREQTGLDRVATGQDAQATAADRIATGEDRVATGQDAQATAADRIATGEDRVATGQDAQATAADRIATGEDRVATGQDAQATAADRIATGEDRVATGQDAQATAADRVQTGEDRFAAARSATDAAADRAAAEEAAGLVDLGALDAAVSATQLDAEQTALDRVATGQDRTATAADRVQTGLDRTAAEIARDSSFANAKGAATIADARALVADNETFIVYAPGAETFDAYRRLTSTTQVLLGTYPSALLVHALAPAIGNVSAILGQAYEEIERLSETQQGDAYTLNLVLELASLIGALSDQVNGGQATLRGGTLAEPALRIGTVGIYSSATDTLSIAIAGSEVARFTASGVTIYGTVTETP